MNVRLSSILNPELIFQVGKIKDQFFFCFVFSHGLINSYISNRSCLTLFHCAVFWGFFPLLFFETGSHFVVQAGLELIG